MKKSIKVVLLIFLFLTILVAVWFILFAYTKKPVYEHDYQSQFENPEYYTVINTSDALEDIDRYIDDIKNNHPNPFAYISENELDQKVRDIKDKWSEEDEIMTGDLYLTLFEITGMIDDSHTTIHWPGFDKLYEIPLDVIYTDDKFYNIRKDSSIPYKAEILSINEMNSENLYNILAKFSHTPLKTGTDKYVQSIFRIMLPLLIGTDENYVVVYKINDIIKSETIQLTDWKNSRINRETVRFYEFGYAGKSIPVLECNQFSGDFSAFKVTVDSFFKKYASAESIVVDIRNNGGGSDNWGYYLFDHIAGDKYTIFGDFIIPVNDYSKAFYTYHYQDTLYNYKVPSQFWELALNIVPDMEMYRDILYAENGEVINRGKSERVSKIDKKDRYKGKVFLLIGGNTGSAAIDLAAAFKFNKKDGIILGEETNHPASYSGNATRYTLPNSKLNYRLPITYCVDADGIDDKRGIMPDYLLNFGIDYYETGRDPELEFLLNHF